MVARALLGALGAHMCSNACACACESTSDAPKVCSPRLGASALAHQSEAGGLRCVLGCAVMCPAQSMARAVMEWEVMVDIHGTLLLKTVQQMVNTRFPYGWVGVAGGFCRRGSR